MNTTITESAIADFMNEKKARLAPDFPELENFEITIRSDHNGFTVCGYYNDHYKCCFGASFAEACESMRKEIGTKEDRIKAAREQAAKLLAEAAALEAQP